MSNECVNIEEDVLADFGVEVLNELLCEHAFEAHDKASNVHICWATDNYENAGFRYNDKIQIESITGANKNLVRPRAAKSKDEQEKRTRDKGEVFTPSWVCNAQNNLIDDAWFGQSGLFNVQNEESHLWIPNTNKIPFPTYDRKTWQDYVCDIRMEMSCGEAPYLVSRYDATTGCTIPINSRIGLFDRKLRVVGENVQNTDEWYLWAFAALKSTYGYEWQGDSLFLARVAVLYTFIDFYKDFVRQKKLNYIKPSQLLLLLAAKIISWNIFQMDGIRMVLPVPGEGGKSKEQSSLSVVTTEATVSDKNRKKNKVHQQNGIGQVVASWDKQTWNENEAPVEIVEFNDWKCNAIVGNPPYQQVDGGAGASAIPIYNSFVNTAKQISRNYISIIMPSRWMTGGRGLDKFRASMLDDTHILKLYDHYSANDCFSNVEIKGGVCYFLWDKNHNDKCDIYTYGSNGYIQHSERFLKEKGEKIFIRDPELIEIKRQVEMLGEKSFESIVSSMKPYGLRGDFFKNPAKYDLPSIRTSKKEGDITIIGLDEKLHRTKRYIPQDYPLPQRDLFDKIKLFVPRNYGTGRMGDLPSKIELAMPFDICTETFVQIGPFQTVEEARNCEAYMRTNFFAVLVGIRKQDQGAGKSVYHYAPLQDFSIRWTDEMLYEKYQLTAKQIDYINMILNKW